MAKKPLNKKKLLLIALGMRGLVVLFVLFLIAGHYMFSAVPDEEANKPIWMNQTATLEQIKEALDAGTWDVNAYYQGRTGLMWAIARPGEYNRALANLLLQYGANPNLKEIEKEPSTPSISMVPGQRNADLAFSGNTAVHLATFMADLPDAIDRLAIVLKHGGNPNVRNGLGDTALHTLRDVSPSKIFEPNSESPQQTIVGTLVRQLVDAGADLNATDKWGFTMMHMIAERNNFPFARLMKDIYGVLIDWDLVAKFPVTSPVKGSMTPDTVPTTAENLAYYRGFYDLGDDLAKRPVFAGAMGPTEKDLYNRTGLMLAVLSSRYDSAQQYIENNADVNAQDNWKNRPLHYAALHRAEPVTYMKLLLNAQDLGMNANPVEVNVANIDGDTPLHLAVEIDNQLEREAAVKLLIEKGANPLLQNNDGDTPLHIAARKNYVHIIKYLKPSELISLANKDLLTPLEIARRLKHRDVIAALTGS